jgi:hypothetical protein
MLNSIYFHLQSDNPEIFRNCILCLIDITRNYYDYLGENLEELINISNKFVFNFL